MTFAHPHVLWLLALPLALLLASLLRRARATENPHPKIPRAQVDHRHWFLVLGPWSFQRRPLAAALALGFLIAALARPQGGAISTPTLTVSRDVLVAVDVSRSMLADDVSPSRLARAQLLVRNLVDELRGERLGLLPFAGTAFLQSPLSADYEIFRTFVEELGPDMIPAGGSNFAALLRTADEAFGPATSPSPDAPPAADRYLVILSDGEAEDDAWRPLAYTLAKRGVRVLALGLGTAAGATVPDGRGGLTKDARGAVVLSRLNPATLQELARLTDGAYRDASTWVDLPALLRDTIARGRASENLTDQSTRRREFFAWFLAPALALLALSLVREFPATPRPTRRPLAASAARAGLGAALLASLLVPDRSTFAAEIPALVERLANAPAPSATDLARLAELTATEGEQARAAASPTSTPLPEGALRDALAAVEAGQRANPKAADWPALRKRLEALLAPLPQQPQQPPPPQQSQQQQPQEKQPDQNSQPQQSPDQKPDQNQSSSPENSASSEQPSATTPPSDKPLGDLNQEPKASSSSSASSDSQPQRPADEPPSQQAGGISASGRPADPADAKSTTDTALVVPQQRLERVRDADAPGRLFQLLQESETPPDARERAASGARQTW